jgi:predicted acylesterase/phospholipase RssA
MAHRDDFDVDAELAKVALSPREPRRAVAFGGGGPAVGISIGFLLALEEWNTISREEGRDHHVIDFPVWVAGCVGAWLTCLYHICDESKGPQSKAQRTADQIRSFFRDDQEYAHFPAPTTFTPDIPELIKSATAYLVDPRNYSGLIVPGQMLRAYQDLVDYYLKPSRWNHGDFCYLMLNSFLAPNPASRFITSLLYQTKIPGLNRLWFDKDYSLLKGIGEKLEKLEESDRSIYINAYSLDRHKSQIFSNKWRQSESTKKLTIEALCASSALPYILSPVKVDGETYVEGALIDSFCFEAVRGIDHSIQQSIQESMNASLNGRIVDSINEVWVSQIVDHSQVKAPTNLLEALNNLIMLYAGTTSRHDVEVFVNEHNRLEYMRHLMTLSDGPDMYIPRPIEFLRLPIQSETQYLWSHENFDNSVAKSKQCCLKFIEAYSTRVEPTGWRTPDMKNIFVKRE